MPFIDADGIRTRYEVYGKGPALLMFSAGGFDATVEKWSTAGVWKNVRMLETMTDSFTCIAHDRREAGESGGRIEPLRWTSYAEQGRAILDHLGIDQAFVIGGCMGTEVAVAFGAAHPDRMLGMILHWPVGGLRYRGMGLDRFATHYAFVKANGLEAVVERARQGEKSQRFWLEPEVGPWVNLLARDDEFAEAYCAQDVERYLLMVSRMGPTFFDRDTFPGTDPEAIMGLTMPAAIIPGHDPAHATSAARYLEECLPNAHYHDLPLSEQNGDSVRKIIRESLEAWSS